MSVHSQPANTGRAHDSIAPLVLTELQPFQALREHAKHKACKEEHRHAEESHGDLGRNTKMYVPSGKKP